MWQLRILEKSPCLFTSPSYLDKAKQGLKMAVIIYLAAN
jgi:hypothetical protein